jgi:hypothetical protein
MNIKNQNEICTIFIKYWKESVKNKDFKKIESLFTKESIFISPIVHKPITEKFKVYKILSWIIEIIKDFQYIEEYKNEDNLSVCLLFKGKILEKKTNKLIDVEGVDLFRLDRNGKIIELKVMLRPLNSTIEVSNEMKNRLLNLSKL